MRVKLSKMPDPKSLSSISLGNLYGGLNLRDDPVNVAKSQSPDMLNLWYEDGVLKKRPGIVQVMDASDANQSSGMVWFYDKLFNGFVVYVDGTAIRYFDPSAETPERKTVSGTKIPDGTPHGTFFTFDERLYYKASGVYIRLSYENGALSAENILYKTDTGYEVSESVYTPIIAINRNPDGSGGDSYQPENRINPQREVWFDIDKSSYDYYLPVHGCRVNKIRLGNLAVVTSGEQRHFTLGGWDVDIYNEDIADESSDYTRIHFSLPLYVQDSKWTSTAWVGSTSKGWNYLSNVVYSNFSLPVTENTEFPDGVVLYRADGDSLPPKYSTTFLNQALALCPYEDKSRVFVFDNGVWCNVFILSPNFSVVKYNADNTEMWMSGYFRVCYEYAADKWSTQDYAGKTNDGWHYAKNAVYSTVDIYYGDAKIISAGTSSGTHSFSESFASLALKHSGLTDSDTYRLIWISENSDTVVFHYVVGTNRLCVTNYDEGNGWFQAKGIRNVTIYRNDPSRVAVSDMTDPGQWGYYTGNIVWAGEDIKWNGYIPGDTLLAETGELTDEYRKIAVIALYRAARDYPNANITGKYAIAKSGKYVTVYVDCGMELKSYRSSTGEFTASGFIAEGYTTDDIADDLDLNLTTPADMSNQLRVTYTKDNPDAMKAIADCRFSASYGGTDAVCVVMGRCEGQPNAIFWSGNGSYGIDATYFPMDQYNLCGTYQDPITGFGKQQSSLVVFQENHTSKASYGITEINGRKYIDLTMATINAERGCDRPWSIRLCGNNLVWMNSRHGVMYLKDTSAAYENMIVNISDNVDGSSCRPGLRAAIKGGEEDNCIGATDGERYYAFTGGDMYAWDYSLSSVGDGIHGLSWTRHSGMDAATMDVQAVINAAPYGVYLGTRSGRILHFDRNAGTDLGENIPCRYTTPLQSMGGYYRLHNVVKVILSVRTKSAGTITVGYGGESLSSQQHISILSQSMPTPVILKPRGLHLHHFQLVLSSDGDDGGLEIMGVTILYNSQGLSK